MDPTRADRPAPETTEPIVLPPSPWRRPLLILTGLALLGGGLALNADRVGISLGEEPSALAMQTHEAEYAPNVVGYADMEDSDEDAGGQGTRHKGEEGKMGRPSSKQKSGLYAMKGPANAVPQMARSFDPNAAAQSAGVLGQMQQDSGHFLTSPYGQVQGLGLTGTGRGGGGMGEGTIGLGNVGLIGKADEDVWGGLGGRRTGERYAEVELNRFIETLKDPKSTFSIDVDTASYANTRRFLLESRQLPPPQAVRTEELINYFDYDYAHPAGDTPFSVTTEVAAAPWNDAHRIVHVGIQGQVIDDGAIPPRNLVFLLDVSGSMSSPDKLPLIKAGLIALANQMNQQDRISIVVYAGAAGAVLPPTSGSDQRKIVDALSSLESGGSTNGAEGIHLAYQLAQESFIPGGINRVIIGSDGDFNVGVTDHNELMELIEAKRQSGVYLSVLGVGTGNFNDHMMEQLADKGNGNYAYIDGELEARKVLVEESGAMLQTIAKDVKIQVEFDPDQVKQHRLIGYENRILAHQDFDDDTKDAGEIGAGHTVTALYEIVPTDDADDDPLMTLNLRFKKPDEDRSKKISISVGDDGREVEDASDDFRFSSAVAMFGQKLRGAPSQSETSYAQIAQLARSALGTDPHCYRFQFLQMVSTAAEIQGEHVELGRTVCIPQAVEQTRVPAKTDAERSTVVAFLDRSSDDEDFDWKNFVFEVLRLLPPLLALPVFVMAFRRPRRRREDEI